MSEEVRVAWTTFPDADAARRIAEQLVNERFAACANILPSIGSVFRWQGKVEQTNETLVIFKLAASRYEGFAAKLKSIHPYDVPEILVLPVVGGWPDYLRWVCENS
ncbi:MAG: divalent-cation tolerance protein CutA [Chthoniobacterales bacterium]